MERTTVFCVGDLKSGYRQTGMAEEDMHGTVFSSEHGLNEFLRMTFGLRNVPRGDQRLTDEFSRIWTTIGLKSTLTTSLYLVEVMWSPRSVRTNY